MQFRFIQDVMDLGSKDTTPAQIVAVYDNDRKAKFTIGINDDVTNLSLKPRNHWLQHRKERSTVSSGDLELMVQ